MRKILYILALVTMLVGVAAGCASQQQSNEKVIKLGISTPLSGGAAAWGNSHVRAVELAFDEVNAQGGLDIKGTKYKLASVAYDHKSSPPEAVSNVERLLSLDKVKYVSVLGGAQSDAVAKKMDAAGALSFPISYGQRTVTPDYPLQFSIYPGPYQAYDVYGYFKKSRPELKSVALIMMDSTSGYFNAQYNTVMAKKYGFGVTSTQFVAAGTKDWSPYLLNMLRDKPDVLEVGGLSPGDTGVILKQARDLGFKGVVMNSGNTEVSEVVKVAGKEYTQGLLTGGYIDVNMPAKMAEWKQKYLAKYGEPFLSTTIPYSLLASSFISALQGAQSLEAKDIAAWLTSGKEFDTVMGKAHYWGTKEWGIPNWLVAPFPIVQVNKDGQAEVVYWAPVPDGQ